MNRMNWYFLAYDVLLLVVVVFYYLYPNSIFVAILSHKCKCFFLCRRNNRPTGITINYRTTCIRCDDQKKNPYIDRTDMSSIWRQTHTSLPTQCSKRLLLLLPLLFYACDFLFHFFCSFFSLLEYKERKNIYINCQPIWISYGMAHDMQ